MRGGKVTGVLRNGREIELHNLLKCGRANRKEKDRT